MPLQITVADDRVAERLGLKFIIENWLPGTIVSLAENLTECKRILSQQQIDIILLDSDILDANSFYLIRSLKENQRSTRILLFSTYDELVYGERYLDGGADGFLQKNENEERIKEALSVILRGEKYVSNRLKEHLLNKRFNLKHQSLSPLNKLTDREMEVCQMLIKGMRVSEIADTLVLHTSTIGTYKSKIYKKLRVKNLVDLLSKFKMHMLSCE
ncbi:response regulator transcription factor [Olivibacter sp. LS-1]|uniref:response regulator transcription factor n=1 Tax=Olivibacter sp. LS-1 TaxID=2592345 RepID=UPI0011EB1050|nr:response regulator transcription factor [Olivibacter sp. LS-1]QEL03308.1 response regulator transcription factor [Olivibacter sp. LS-1]